MRKLIFLIIVCFIGYYGYKHKEEIKVWVDKILGKIKVETVSKKNAIKTNVYKFSVTRDRDAIIRAEGIDDVSITLLSIKAIDKVLIMINKKVCEVEKKSDTIRFLENNNKLTLKLLKTYKNKADFSVSISVVKENPKEAEIVNIEK